MKHNKVIHSVRFQLTALFFLLAAGVVLLLWIINNVMLDKYYLAEKKNALTSFYTSLKEAADSNSVDSDEFDIQLVRLTGRDNIGVIIHDADSKTVKCYASDPSTMERRLYENIFNQTRAYSEITDGTSDINSDGAPSDGAGQVSTYLVKKLDTDTGCYMQIVIDTRTNTQYMEMWGVLGDNNIFLLRTAMDSVYNSSRIAIRFFGFAGIFAAITAGIAAYYAAGRFTKPIKRIAAISDRMKQLDFSAKYSGRSNNEIEELGSNINDLSETLEKTISELKTANNQLRSDLEEKEKIESMRQEFISNVTHELKTPLAIIQGYAEGLQEGIADDEESRNEYCGIIVDESQKMNNMVKKLLTLNQLEFGKTEVVMERFDVVQMVRGMLQSDAVLIEKAGASLRTHGDGEPRYVWADQFLVEEVFTNYLSNAIHHISGEKVIDIGFAQKENCIRISVFNTGSPIPEESLPRIWEKFYKVDKARTRAYGGSGVGLSIVKAIMDLLHQNYGAVNYDNGVEFWFELDTEPKNS